MWSHNFTQKVSKQICRGDTGNLEFDQILVFRKLVQNQENIISNPSYVSVLN